MQGKPMMWLDCLLERAELTDDDGNVYKGRGEIADVFYTLL